MNFLHLGDFCSQEKLSFSSELEVEDTLVHKSLQNQVKDSWIAEAVFLFLALRNTINQSELDDELAYDTRKNIDSNPHIQEASIHEKWYLSQR